MILAKDFYTATLSHPLGKSGALGMLYVKYTVKSVANVRNLSFARSYFVTCTVRATIPNASNFGTPGPTISEGNLGYFQYPVLLRIQTALTLNNLQSLSPNATYRLVEYNPRTINTAVNVSANLGVNASAGASSGSSTGKSQSISHTTGSSDTTTNSYSASVTVGYPWSASASASYSHDSSETEDQSTSSDSATDSGRSRSRDQESGSNSSFGDSMTVKDWVGYVQLDDANQTPTWIWAQEYPWDVTRYGYVDGSGSVTLPDFVLNQMFNIQYGKNDTIQEINDIYAPSALSMTTIDFAMSSVWQIDIDPVCGDYPDIAILPNHTITLGTASHGVSEASLPSKSGCFVTIDEGAYFDTVSGPSLDLTLLGLDPIAHNRPNNGAVIGFIPNKFLTLMSKTSYGQESSYFKILSAANNLQVTGTGFSVPSEPVTNSNSPLSITGGKTARFSAQLFIFFKLPEASIPLNLFFKHWISAPGHDGALSFYFNPQGYTPPTASSAASGNLPTTPDLVQHVTSTEGAGADANLLTVNLRNSDYSTIDYHDYLVPGLNLIVVSIDATTEGEFDYVLRALAVGM